MKVWRGFGPTGSDPGPLTHLGDGYFGALVDELDHILGLPLVRRYEEALGECEDLSRILLAHEAGRVVLQTEASNRRGAGEAASAAAAASSSSSVCLETPQTARIPALHPPLRCWEGNRKHME